MKKYILGLIFAVLMMGSITMVTTISVSAQTRYVARVVDRNGRVRWVPVSSPSYYRRHRNAINLAVGTGAGAVIGGLIGGKKGALIGAGTGLGTSALYSYVIRKNKRVYRKVNY